jgi:hypothetical protein
MIYEETKMAYATTQDLIQVEPTITEYGVLDFDAELARSEAEINRVLKVRWFQIWLKSQNNPGEFTASLLDSTQWTMATVYHALAYHICPKLTKFENQGSEDNFQVRMDYYAGRFEHEMDLCLREGVRYDVNSSGVITADETRSVTPMRLVR